MDEGNLETHIKKKVIGVLDIGYTGETGITELLEKSKDIIAEAEITKERNLVAKFLDHLGKDDGLALYGVEEVKRALAQGAVETAMLSEDSEDALIEEFEKLAEDAGSKLEIISLETREGQQIKSLGGAAAILRYKL